MTKDQLLRRIGELLPLCDGQNASRGEPEHVFNGALTVMIGAYGADSHQIKFLLKRRDEIARETKNDAIRKEDITAAVRGVLENLRQEIEAGLLTSLERRITSELLGDLVQLARAALSEQGDGAKNVAAVLAAAAFEDTLRRIAREHAGLIGRDDLADVVTRLKDAGALVPPQLSIVFGHLNFRNRALHAEWETIERAAVASVLGLVEELLLKHFS